MKFWGGGKKGEDLVHQILKKNSWTCALVLFQIFAAVITCRAWAHGGGGGGGRGFGGGGGFHGGGAGFHGGGGGFHGGGGGFHGGGGGFHGGGGGFHGGGGGFHGGMGSHGFWRPGFGYWNAGWGGRGWYGRSVYPWFYPGWYYGWYGRNLLFAGYPFYFGSAYYRPFYLPANFVVNSPVDPNMGGNTDAPPPYNSTNGQEPVLPAPSQEAVKTIIEKGFEFASSHASTFWKYCRDYPQGYPEIDAYFDKFAIQKNQDLSLFPDSELEDTLTCGDQCVSFFCCGDDARETKKATRTSNIKEAYRNKMTEELSSTVGFNFNVANLEIACNALYGSISKTYSDRHPNDPTAFDFAQLEVFFSQLERTLDSKRLTRLPTAKSSEVPRFILQ